MDYRAYRAEKHIQPRHMIAALRTSFPNYGKATQSMVDNPIKYGVCLLPAAEEIITSRYGLPAAEAQKKRKRKPNRTKPNRMVVYLSDGLSYLVSEKMKRDGWETSTSLLEYLLYNWLLKGDQNNAEL